MGKASSSKKVTRAASTGGGRTRQAARPWGWYSAIGVVALLGVLLIVVSRNDRQDLAAEGRTNPPRVGLDHWHAAFGLYLCDSYAAPLPEPSPLPGLHTHGDEVIHIEPLRPAESGNNATLGRWAEENGLTLTPTKVAAGGQSFANGDKCGDKAGEVKVRVDDDIITYDPRDVLLRDNQRITVAFVPDGTEIPPLPQSALDNLAKQSPAPSTPLPSVPGDTVPGGVETGHNETAPTDAAPGGSVPPASAPPTETSVPPASAATATTTP
jgi:hypothetical protein